MEKKNKLILFDIIINLFAIVFVVYCYRIYGFEINFKVIFMLFLSTMVSLLPVDLPNGGNISVNFAIDVANILIFNPMQVIFIASLSFVIAELILNKGKVKLLNFSFNNAQIVIINVAIWWLFHMSGGKLSNPVASNVIPLFISTLLYITINYSFVSIYYSINNGTKLSKMFNNFKFVIPNYFALIPLGYLVAYLFNNIGYSGILLFFIPLLVARHTFKLYMETREMYLDTISSLAATIDAKDNYTAGHSHRVSQYTVAIAETLKMPEDEIENLKYIALLHDIGKIAIPETILNKPGKLSDEEYDVMKYHAIFGSEIVKKIKFLKGQEIIRAHHERYDGGGYPDNAIGSSLPVGARIIAVADSFDAMTTTRPYRPAFSAEKALEELQRCAGKQFDKTVVDAFVSVYPSIVIDEASLNEHILPVHLHNKNKLESEAVAL